MAKVHLLWYLWKVRLALTGSRKQKKKLLTIVEASVREFASENPGCDYRELVKRFGEPERIAEQFVAEMEPEELLVRLRIRNNVLVITAAALTLIVVMWYCYLADAFQNFRSDMRGYAIVEVIEVENVIVEEGAS